MANTANRQKIEQRAAIFCEHVNKRWQLCSTGALADQRLAVKDLFAIAGEKNGAGNPDWLARAEPSLVSADTIKKLMFEGCEFVGFTHTDEIAYSLEGNNQHYGAIDNPKYPGHSCGGSSTGSAAAVAAGFADIGLGTDTGGSIRVPASYCGLYGLRPSHGLISSHGLIPLAPAFDTTGWLTTNAELLQQVGDVLLPQQACQPVENLLICEPLFDLVNINLANLLSDQLDQIAGNFKRVSKLKLPSTSLLADLADCFRVLQGREIARTHGRWIKECAPTFAPAINSRFEMALNLTQRQENKAKRVQQLWSDTLANQLSANNALFLPTTPTTAPKLAADTSALRMQILTLTALAGLSGSAQAHLPHINVHHQQQEIPYGYSLLMAANQDKSLLNLVNQLSANQASASAAVATLNSLQ